MNARAAQLRSHRAQMRADLEAFRERIADRRAKDDAAANLRRSGCSVTEPATELTTPPAALRPSISSPSVPRREPVEDDDEFYHPRSWLV